MRTCASCGGASGARSPRVGSRRSPEGDVAGYIYHRDLEGTVVHTVLMLVGREVNAINLYRGSVQEARTLAPGSPVPQWPDRLCARA